MSKMNKTDLYKLCKELQEENKRLQFDNNCLEEKIDDQFLGLYGLLNDNGYCATSEGQIISFVKDIIDEHIKLERLWEEEFQSSKRNYEEVKKLRNIIKQLLKADDIFKPTPQGNSD